MPIAHPTGIIRHNVLIPLASPKEVYRAFLSSKDHAEFTGSEAKCSARVGGRFTAWDKYISGKNVQLVVGKKIVQEWKTSEWPEGYGPSILKISLKKKDGGRPGEYDSVASPSLTGRPIRQGLVRVLLGTVETILPR
jgi:uncharacterized protein YndB with AHSA1/START domain